MWASHGLDRFCVRPYLKLGPELQVSDGLIHGGGGGLIYGRHLMLVIIFIVPVPIYCTVNDIKYSI